MSDKLWYEPAVPELRLYVLLLYIVFPLVTFAEQEHCAQFMLSPNIVLLSYIKEWSSMQIGACLGGSRPTFRFVGTTLEWPTCESVCVWTIIEKRKGSYLPVTGVLCGVLSAYHILNPVLCALFLILCSWGENEDQDVCSAFHFLFSWCGEGLGAGLENTLQVQLVQKSLW